MVTKLVTDNELVNKLMSQRERSYERNVIKSYQTLLATMLTLIQTYENPHNSLYVNGTELQYLKNVRKRLSRALQEHTEYYRGKVLLYDELRARYNCKTLQELQALTKGENHEEH